MKTMRKQKSPPGHALRRIVPQGFKRASLAEQVAKSLRIKIHSGELRTVLPSERSLGAQMDASRPVIRQALHLLKEEGLLEIQRGSPAKILRSPPHKTGIKDRTPSRVILLLTDADFLLSPWSLQVLNELRRELSHQDYHLELAIEPELNRRNPEIKLRKLLDRYKAQNWILAGASEAVQKWFQKTPFHVIVMGNIFPSLHFPYVNDNLRAVTRHAAGVFLSRGHRHIAFLMRQRGSAGETDEEGGFLEAFVATPGTHGIVVRHRGQVEGIRRRLHEIFLKKSRATALLVSHAADTLVAMNWFLEKGIRVPGDVSLISFQWESFLERLRPLPAWYYTDPKVHARKLCRLIFHPVYQARSPRLLFPVFCQNETIRTLSA